MFKYIIRADHRMTLAVHSELNFFEFKEYVALLCKKTHPKGKDVVFTYGVDEFMNPVVMTVEDYANFCPALM